MKRQPENVRHGAPYNAISTAFSDPVDRTDFSALSYRRRRRPVDPCSYRYGVARYDQAPRLFSYNAHIIGQVNTRQHTNFHETST